MKLKKVVAVALASAMVLGTLSTVGCSKASKKKSDTLVVWTLADDLKQFADKYTKETGKKVEVNVIEPANYPSKLQTSLGAKSSDVDVIVGEPQMLDGFYEAGFFEDLSQDPYKADDYADKIVDYVFEAGKSDDGKVRALSYQVTPGSIIYRRDLAKEIWGTDDPDEIAKKFKDYDTILNTAREAKKAGYCLFSDSGNLRWYAYSSEAWVVDGKLNLNDAALGYMDAAEKLYKEELVAQAPEWSAAWYESMAGTLPMNAGWSKLEEVKDNATTQVVSYSLPSWGALIVRDNAKENKGKFGVCSGPTSYFGGGTFIGVSAYSEKKSEAWDFVKFCTLNKDTANWWIDESDGDVVSYKEVLEANKDYQNESFGGQKTYEFYMKEAEKIDYSVVTKYDTELGNLWGTAIEAVQKGEMTQKEAIADFKTQVATVYPEIKIPK